MLVRLDNITVLDGIVRAEAHPELQLLGLSRSLKALVKCNSCAATDDELRAFLFGPPLEGRLRRPPRLGQVTVINLTDLIVNIRRQAAKKKIDLGVPLCMTPDDPRYQELRRKLLEICGGRYKNCAEGGCFRCAARAHYIARGNSMNTAIAEIEEDINGAAPRNLGLSDAANMGVSH